MTDGEKIARLSESLCWALAELRGLKTYMDRPERGEYGVECAVCRNEWFEESDLIEMDNARQLLNACGVAVTKHPKE